MKKYLIAGLLVLSILIPNLSSAQESSDPTFNVSNCASFSRDLRYQLRDAGNNGEISTLQNFLRSKNYLNTNPTGYFGPLTVRAIKNFQSANGISPTGYVGPVTRAKIKAMTCGEQVVPSSTPTPIIFPTTTVPTQTHPNPIPNKTSSQSFLSGCHSNSSNEWSSTTGMVCGNSPSTSYLAPAGCNSTSNYSSTTGLSCTDHPTPAPSTCSGSGYDSATGFLCGCTSTYGYSSVNGNVCAAPTQNNSQSLPDGCISNMSFSSTTGQPCNVN